MLTIVITVEIWFLIKNFTIIISCWYKQWKYGPSTTPSVSVVTTYPCATSTMYSPKRILYSGSLNCEITSLNVRKESSLNLNNVKREEGNSILENFLGGVPM